MPCKSLNLSEHYVPNWNRWAIVREIYCNFLDADPDFYHHVTDHSVTFATKNTPSFSRLTVLGASTSRGNDNAIGEFGEGFKLASLVATRLGYGLEVYTPEGKMTFVLKHEEGLEERVLYAVIEKKPTYDGCKIILHMPGVEDMLRDNFVKREVLLIDSRETQSKMYSKGVFICELGDALFSWNLNIPLNRDRSAINAWDLRAEVGKILAKDNVFSQEIYDEIFRNPEALEMQALRGSNFPVISAIQKVKAAFFHVHGPMALITSQSEYHDEVARMKGFSIIPKEIVPAGYELPTVKDTLKTTDVFEVVGVSECIQKTIATALDIIEAPFEIRFFKIFDDCPLGKYDNGIIYLSEILALPGRLHQLLQVLCHEVCHARHNDADGTFLFEDRLDSLCGRLLKKLLEK